MTPRIALATMDNARSSKFQTSLTLARSSIFNVGSTDAAIVRIRGPNVEHHRP